MYKCIMSTVLFNIWLWDGDQSHPVCDQSHPKTGFTLYMLIITNYTGKSTFF